MQEGCTLHHFATAGPVDFLHQAGETFRDIAEAPQSVLEK